MPLVCRRWRRVLRSHVRADLDLTWTGRDPENPHQLLTDSYLGHVVRDLFRSVHSLALDGCKAITDVRLENTSLSNTIAPPHRSVWLYCTLLTLLYPAFCFKACISPRIFP